MRITRDILLKIVRDTVSQRSRADRALLAVFLQGSLLEDEYLLGGATDIDLFFIHSDAVPVPREIVHLSDDVHLDIAHYLQRDFRNTRLLRIHPWLGPTFKDCKIYYDPQHFLDFTQASVRGQFDSPDFVVERSRKQAESARQAWLALHEARAEPRANDVQAYLQALENAANAIAGIYATPVTERRFLMRLPAIFETAGRPGLYPGLLGLLGVPHLEPDTLKSWLPLWSAAYQALSPQPDASQLVTQPLIPARLHPMRLSYYSKAITALLASSQPYTALWPLIRTWTLAVASLPSPGDHLLAWNQALGFIGLTGSGFSERLSGLDAYLDMVEEVIDEWGAANGASAA